MKKQMKRVLTGMLAAAMLMSTAALACEEEETKPQTPGYENVEEINIEDLMRQRQN